MGKELIVNHSLRLNPANEQHRRVEKVLSDLNTDVHKSLNQFTIDALDYYIQYLEGNVPLCNDSSSKEVQEYVTGDDLEKAVKGLKDEIMIEIRKEVFGMLASAFLSGRALQEAAAENVVKMPEKKEQEQEVETDETMMGLASSWG